MRRSASIKLLAVVDQLYAGILDEREWAGALEAMHSHFSASALALFSVDPRDGRLRRSEIVGVERRVLEDYGSRWIGEDARHAVGLRLAAEQPLTEDMLVPWREFTRTEVYNEFLRPEGISRFMAVWVERVPTRGVVLSVQRPEAAGAYSPSDRDQLSRLLPHLRRVVNIKDRLASAGIAAQALIEAQDRLPFGVVVLDEAANILEASQSARALLAIGDGICSTHGVLSFPSMSDQSAVAARLAEDPLAARSYDPIRIKRTAVRQSFSVLPLPLPRRQQNWLTPAAAWILIILDPLTMARDAATRIRRALVVTPAEASLVEQLIGGRNLREATAALGIALSTARTQLKSVFAKNGLRGQSELIRVLLSGESGGMFT